MNSAQNCLTCEVLNFRSMAIPNKCPCLPGNYDTFTQICPKCHYTCLTCKGPTNLDCLSCDSTKFRSSLTVNGSCLCMDGYYDSDTDCQLCHKTCLTCSKGTNASCLTCNAANFRVYQNGFCNCMKGYYDDGISISCKPCHYTCQTCSVSGSSNCSSCDVSKNRFLVPTSNSITGTCDCKTSFMDDGINMNCLACHFSCKTCFDTTINGCFTCESNSFRNGPIISGATSILNTCPCNSGYFENNQAVCGKCHYSCKDCLNNNLSTSCTSCDSTLFRGTLTSTPTGQCPCLAGYIDSGIS